MTNYLKQSDSTRGKLNEKCQEEFQNEDYSKSFSGDGKR